MSYYFDMCFWQASSLSVAMRKAQEIVNAACTSERMKQKIKDNLYYIPSIRLNAKAENWEMAMQADSSWLYQLFNFRFVYWKEHRLLGMVGTLPENGSKATSCIGFQNSCDQDYELKTWPSKIPFFRSRVEKFAALLDMPPKEAFNTLCQKGFMNESDVRELIDEGKCNKETAEYQILSLLYQNIYKALRLDMWLYGKDDESFQRFALCGIQTTEQKYELERYLKHLVITHRGNLGQKKIMYIPLVFSTQDNPSAYTMIFKYMYDYYEGRAMNGEEAKKEIRNVVERYLESEDGKRFKASRRGRINWLDAVCSVPIKLFHEAGFEVLKRDAHCDAVTADADAIFGG